MGRRRTPGKATKVVPGSLFDLPADSARPLRKCFVCRNTFVPQRSNRWCCSASCRVKKSRRVRRARRPALKCDGCGRTFTPGRATQRYCGRKCQVRMDNKRRRAKVLSARRRKGERPWGVKKIADALGVPVMVVRSWLGRPPRRPRVLS
jgi:hypothetical protein